MTTAFPQSPQREVATGLYWGVRSSFLNYIATSGDGLIRATDDIGTDGQSLFRFPVASVVETADGWQLSFDGELSFLAHFGALDISIGSPRITLGAVGVLAVDVRGRTVEIADVAVAQPVTIEGRLVWPPLRTTLTEAGSVVFGGAYSAGEDLDALRIVVQATGSVEHRAL